MPPQPARTTLCPKCLADNRLGVRFCRVCGCALPETPADARVSEAETTCLVCGAVLRAGARFCRACGAAINGAATPPASAGEPDLDSNAVAHASDAQGSCPGCGAPLRPGARFCRLCGQVVVDLPVPEGAESEARCLRCGERLRSGSRFCRACGAPTGPELTEQASAPVLSPELSAMAFGTGALLPMQVVAQRYLILEKIAQGGMGAIYKAHDRRLEGKVVVLKEMSESAIAVSEREKVLESFTREAELLASLDHPNLVKVTDYLQENDRHYMVMEYVQGRTLQQEVDAHIGPFSEEEVLVWAEQLCDVLSFLHSQSPPVVYRDLKPGNVMVSEDRSRVKLIDFGIARFYKPGKKRDTIQFGTDGYAPPEQYGQAQTDERADLYALGATLHQLLSGHDPGDKLFHFDLLRQLNPAVSRRTGDAIARAVKANREERFSSMVEFWKALSGSEPAWPHLALVERGQGTSLQDIRAASTGPATGELSFGRIAAGQRGRALTRCLTVAAGEKTSLVPAAPWIEVQPSQIDTGGGEAIVKVQTGALQTGRLELAGGPLKRWVGWHTARLVPVQKEYRSYIAVRPESGSEELMPISLVVAPSALQVGTGWLATVVAMAVEVGAPLGLVLAWLVSAGVL